MITLTRSHEHIVLANRVEQHGKDPRRCQADDQPENDVYRQERTRIEAREQTAP